MYTPGPWHVRDEDSLDGHLDFPVLDTEQRQVGGACFRVAVDTSDDASWTKAGQPVAHANARLIASAPKLLEALEGAQRILHGDNCQIEADCLDVCIEARAAIAEAKGE